MEKNNPNNLVSADTHIPTRSVQQRLVALVVVVVLLVIGVAIFKYLLASKPEAKRKKPSKMQALVQVQNVSATDESVLIQAFGKVKAAKEIGLQSRVAGTVVMVNPSLVPGGMVKKGDVLARLDDTDFQLALQQKKDVLAQAQSDLRIEEGNQNVAKQEWDIITSLTDDVDSSTGDLALRKPQLAKAQVKIQSAKTDVERAELDLSRTSLLAPFSAVIREKHIDMGSQITTQSVVATLLGVENFWVEISVPTKQLQWIALPGEDGNSSKVEVVSENNRFAGKILKLLPDLEQDGLMARLLIEVKDPMGSNKRRTPLLINSFVQVEINGRQLDAVYKIPRSALQDNQKVFVVTQDNTLHVQPVTVAWDDAEYAYVKEGLTDQSRLVVSQLPAPIEAMPLKVAGQGQQKEQAPVKE